MDIGLDRKAVKGKPGLHVHFYTSLDAKVYSVVNSQSDLSSLPLHTAESLCTKMFMDKNFQFDENELNDGSGEHATILPAFMHLFQLWDCETKQYKVTGQVNT